MYSQYFQFGSAQQDTGVDTEGVCMILEPGCPRIEHTHTTMLIEQLPPVRRSLTAAHSVTPACLLTASMESLAKVARAIPKGKCLRSGIS